MQTAADHVDGDFLVVNGYDIIDDTMIRDTADRYDEPDTAASLAVATSDRAEECVTVGVNDGVADRIGEHGEGVTARIGVGVYGFDRSVLYALYRVDFEDGERPLTGAIDELDGPAVVATPNGIWFNLSYPWAHLRTNGPCTPTRNS